MSTDSAWVSSRRPSSSATKKLGVSLPDHVVAPEETYQLFFEETKGTLSFGLEHDGWC